MKLNPNLTVEKVAVETGLPEGTVKLVLLAADQLAHRDDPHYDYCMAHSEGGYCCLDAARLEQT